MNDTQSAVESTPVAVQATPPPAPPPTRFVQVSEQTALRVDSEGYVRAGPVKLCRVDRVQGVLLFHDKDKKRSQRRGSAEIVVKVEELVRLVGPSPSRLR